MKNIQKQTWRDLGWSAKNLLTTCNHFNLGWALPSDCACLTEPWSSTPVLPFLFIAWPRLHDFMTVLQNLRNQNRSDLCLNEDVWNRWRQAHHRAQSVVVLMKFPQNTSEPLHDCNRLTSQPLRLALSLELELKCHRPKWLEPKWLRSVLTRPSGPADPLHCASMHPMCRTCVDQVSHVCVECAFHLAILSNFIAILSNL